MAPYVSCSSFAGTWGVFPMLILTQAARSRYAVLGQITQKQKSEPGNEPAMSNNGSSFHLSSPCLIKEKEQRGAWPPVHLLPLMLPWGEVDGCCGLCFTDKETRGQRGRDCLGASHTYMDIHMHILIQSHT